MSQCNGITLKGLRCKRRVRANTNLIDGKQYCGTHYLVQTRNKPQPPIQVVDAQNGPIPEYLINLIPPDLLQHSKNFTIEDLKLLFLPENFENNKNIKIIPEDTNKIFECQCCFCECFESDKLKCSAGHEFCKECLSKYITEKITGGDYKLKCMASTECEGIFSHNILKTILDPKLYKTYNEKEITEILAEVNIKNLYSCSKCLIFCVELDDYYIKNLKEPKFICLNSDCKFVSCIKCKKAYHGIRDCNSVKTDDNVRKIIEEILSKHRMRSCTKCGKEFIRIDGCNKIICSCKTKSCYLCRTVIEDYSHFKTTSCKLYTDEAEIIKLATIAALEEIYTKYDKVTLNKEVIPILYGLDKSYSDWMNKKLAILEKKKADCVIL